MRPEKRVRQRARNEAEQFDAALLHNRVYDQVQGSHDREHDLARLVELTEDAYAFAEDDRDAYGDDPIGDAAFDAAERLNDQVDAVVAEQVARACAVVATEAQDWTDAWDREELAAARHEAREWLQTHTEAAERAGVLDDVTGIEREVEA